MNDGGMGKTMKLLLAELKDEFRRWYSMLSIQEIMSNTNLIRALERVEKLLNEAILEANALR